MATPTPPKNPPADEKGEKDDKAGKKAMTAAEAAKRVKRALTTFTEKKLADGSVQRVQKIEQVSVSADEVIDFKDQGDYVVVVTRDGQKLRSEDAA